MFKIIDSIGDYGGFKVQLSRGSGRRDPPAVWRAPTNSRNWETAISPLHNIYYKSNPIKMTTAAKMTSPEEVNDKSHHNPSGGFTNPWPSFRYVSIFGMMNYARKNWNREASKVPPQSDLYVKVLEEKKMAWERIRNPPKDRIQATWYQAPHVNG